MGPQDAGAPDAGAPDGSNEEFECANCTNQAESSAGECYQQGESCYVDTNCVLLAACYGGCTTDGCIANCNATEGSTATAELMALTSCDCAACAGPCAAQCIGQDAGVDGGDGG